VHGKIDSNDQLVDSEISDLELAESYEGGRHRFDGRIVLDHSGPFGYTVRVLPSHAAMATPADLDLIALPQESTAYTAI